MAKTARDRVFLSYAHEDLDTVHRIYAGLKERQLNVWFDKIDLGAGRWKPAITKAIAQSRFFLICLSQATLKKTGDEESGFQDVELNTAYSIAQEQPDDEHTLRLKKLLLKKSKLKKARPKQALNSFKKLFIKP